MAVAQLVESQIVILVVVGSSPISHPSQLCRKPGSRRAFLLLIKSSYIRLHSDRHFFDHRRRLVRGNPSGSLKYDNFAGFTSLSLPLGVAKLLTCANQNNDRSFSIGKNH